MPERISALHQITAAMLRNLELERLLPEIVHAAKLVARADAAAVMLVNESQSGLRIAAHEGLSERYARTRRFPMERAREMYEGFDTHVEVDLPGEAKPEDAQLI